MAHHAVGPFLRQLRMRVRVVADFIARRQHALGFLRERADEIARHEEGDIRVVLRQHFQHLIGVLAAETAVHADADKFPLRLHVLDGALPLRNDGQVTAIRHTAVAQPHAQAGVALHISGWGDGEAHVAARIRPFCFRQHCTLVIAQLEGVVALDDGG